MTTILQPLDRRTHVVLRTLPKSKVQTLDRRTQLVFRLLEISEPSVPDPPEPRSIPYFLTPKEKLRARNARNYTDWLKLSSGYPPHVIVAKLRGANFKVMNQHLRPADDETINVLARASRDVAGWLGFSSVVEYKMTLKVEREAIFERRQS